MLASYMVISIIFTRQLILVHEGKKDERSLKPIAVIAFIAGLLATVTSFVFCFQIARPLWNTPVQPLSFLISALVAAIVVLAKQDIPSKAGGIVIGAILALVAIYLIKPNLLQAQLFNPLITYAGPPVYGGTTGPYIPSLIEIGLPLGIISLGALLLNLGLSKLNLGMDK